jgi:diadenosine tetraphosphate (Ap4A) HIT family hydrolase
MAIVDEDSCGVGNFCTELAGLGTSVFQDIYAPEFTSREILSTRSFTLVVDLSPLQVGHLLLLPKDHYLSFAEAIPAHSEEFFDTIATVEAKYRETFGDLCFLEHGSSTADDRNACITHAHLHLLPSSYPQILQIAVTDDLQSTELRRFSDLNEHSVGRNAYYLIAGAGAGVNAINIFQPQRSMPRQYIRSVIGRNLGMVDPEWDYALFPRPDLLRETLRRTNSWRV